jgi:hypothetical protein
VSNRKALARLWQGFCKALANSVVYETTELPEKALARLLQGFGRPEKALARLLQGFGRKTRALSARKQRRF